jgi:hypothetical protein
MFMFHSSCYSVSSSPCISLHYGERDRFCPIHDLYGSEERDRGELCQIYPVCMLIHSQVERVLSAFKLKCVIIPSHHGYVGYLLHSGN